MRKNTLKAHNCENSKELHHNASRNMSDESSASTIHDRSSDSSSVHRAEHAVMELDKYVVRLIVVTQ